MVPWYVDRLELPALWSRARGSGASIAVLDSGAAPVSALSSARISQLDDRLRPCTLRDRFDHGTRCVGLIASRDDDAPGLAPEAEIHVYETFGPEGKPLVHLVAAALEHAVRSGADVVSCSLGLPQVSSALREALALAEEHRVPVVVASGNDAAVHMPFPEDVDGLLTVGGIEDDERILRGSRYGDWTRVFAPGFALSVPTARGQQDTQWLGTSGSAAFVSGLLALGLSLLRRRASRSSSATREAQRARVAKALLDSADERTRLVDPPAFFDALAP